MNQPLLEIQKLKNWIKKQIEKKEQDNFSLKEIEEFISKYNSKSTTETIEFLWTDTIIENFEIEVGKEPYKKKKVLLKLSQKVSVLLPKLSITSISEDCDMTNDSIIDLPIEQYNILIQLEKKENQRAFYSGLFDLPYEKNTAIKEQIAEEAIKQNKPKAKPKKGNLAFYPSGTPVRDKNHVQLNEVQYQKAIEIFKKTGKKIWNMTVKQLEASND